ncbi:hypothetical protein [Sphingosinicella rhizophila]|uniref:Restriction endonuclease n=1 Tax=Sphingosinicella rhizophila TaxID=3050082 RepID=A0ABU3Q6V6_9SPHN|nr:hypothetical protein [Sphingosinicella sp. GR2756]MDT9599135.1 hypothetical protein [Sphingosinicella sp. GR2756]
MEFLCQALGLNTLCSFFVAFEIIKATVSIGIVEASMFEVTGDEIQRLGDTELRTLVSRLAIAELRAKCMPIAGVTAGGHQDAADGGLDVRVEVAVEGYEGDFVPRVPLGVQVKKPDMSASAIKDEMSPKGILRPVIGNLADDGGAYIIVSSQGSVADKPLSDRRTAMSESLDGHPSQSKLLVDFYDRERLATWVNQYPGVAAWVRAKVGRPLAGWQSLGDWSGIRVGGDGKFIADDAACLIDARTGVQHVLAVVDGINSIRDLLSQPAQCVRLIGMSGLGKTRLVQALFESEVGGEALDPSLAIYTDYSDTPDPTAKQLALQFLETDQRAILVVDNCNPQTHADLAKICGSGKSQVSLITVEYDVRDDEPERTEIFRLQAASDGTIGEWLKANFDYVAQVDRDRIAEFSGGNFRVAGVLAETLKRGGTLGNLRDRDLFARIFQQRNDHSDDLLNAAEALSLVYSFDGMDLSDTGELAFLAPIAGANTIKLYAFVAELKRRSVVQSRGRWRALLPHAIANRLAAQALERIPPDQLDSLCANAPARLQKSLSRRLGYLHDSTEAQQAIRRWLQPNGPFGNIFVGDDNALEMLRNIAPVAPTLVLARIEAEVAGPDEAAILDPKAPSRWQLTMVLKSLAYDPALFDRATSLLGKFVAAESQTENHNSARGAFEELFHLHLSGTQTSPDQRRNLIRTLFGTGDNGPIRCAGLALDGLLQSGHFSSSSNFDFGARPRDFGWYPPTYGDIWDWYSDAIYLAVELAANAAHRSEIKCIVSANLRGILGIEACLNAIEAAASEFIKDGEWIDGWLAIRGAIQFDGDRWQPEVKARVAAIEERLRPSDALNVARAYVLQGRGVGFDVLDGERNENGERDYARSYERLAQKTTAIGRDFGSQADLMATFLPEVLQSSSAPRAFAFGVGLAQSAAPPTETWATLRSALIALPVESRCATTLGGFLRELNSLDPDLCSSILDDLLTDTEMAAHFVYLQAQVGIDDKAIARLRAAISHGNIEAYRFHSLASGVIGTAPQSALVTMLDDLCGLSAGPAVALEILHMAIYCLKTDGKEIEGALYDVGHRILLGINYKDTGDVREHRIQETIKHCYVGAEGETRARDLIRVLKAKIAAREVYAFQLDYAFDALFEAQPRVALDEFFLVLGDDDDPIYGGVGLDKRSPLEKVKPEVLWAWADKAADSRYPLIGRSLSIFTSDPLDQNIGLSPLFVEGIDRAPDRAAFLEHNASRLAPSGWSGNLSVILDRRRELLLALSEHSDATVRSWVSTQISKLADWADREREREGEQEERFE